MRNRHNTGACACACAPECLTLNTFPCQFKMQCRKLGIMRWPHRKLQSVQHLIDGSIALAAKTTLSDVFRARLEAWIIELKGVQVRYLHRALSLITILTHRSSSPTQASMQRTMKSPPKYLETYRRWVTKQRWQERNNRAYVLTHVPDVRDLAAAEAGAGGKAGRGAPRLVAGQQREQREAEEEEEEEEEEEGEAEDEEDEPFEEDGGAAPSPSPPAALKPMTYREMLDLIARMEADLGPEFRISEFHSALAAGGMSTKALVQLFKRSLGTETARVAFRHLLQTFTRIDADKMVYLK